MSLRRFITFVGDLFSVGTSRRRLKSSDEDSHGMKRGALMRAARQPDLQSQVRALQSNDPLMRLELNDLITLTFDFNFGDGEQDLYFGVIFQYNGDESLANSTKTLLQKFMSETLGDHTTEDFSFKDTAEELANDLIKSLVVDITVDLDFAFHLDLSPMFNSSAISATDRIPKPFIEINQFDISGILGVNDWTSSLSFSDVEFAVAQAKALLNISSTLSSSPIRVNSPSDLTALVNTSEEDSSGIIFQASLDVIFPIFLIIKDVGFGAKIQYL